MINELTAPHQRQVASLVSAGTLTYRPEQEGAAGDGVTNDSVAIVRAAKRAAAFGATLLMTAPKYNTGAGVMVLPDGLRMSGSSKLEGGPTTNSAIKVGSRTRIEGVSIRNSATGYRYAVSLLPGASDVHFTGVTFHEGAGVGIYMNEPGIHDVTIDRCWFDGHGYGVLSNSGGNEAAQTGAHDLHNVTIARNRFTNISADGIEINHPFGVASSGERGTARNVLISKNIIEVNGGSGRASGLAIGVAGVQRVTITDNIITAARYEGIHVEDDSHDVVISGNHITGLNGIDAYAGINVLTSCVNVAVFGNVVNGVRGSAVGAGIIAPFNAYTKHTQNLTIYGNTVCNVDGSGISVAANTGGAFRVYGNNVHDVLLHGINVSGDVQGGFAIHDNTVTTAGGYGISIHGNAAQVRPHNVRNNIVTAAALGEYSGVPITEGFPTDLQTRTSYQDAGPASTTTTADLPLFRVGASLHGMVRVTAHTTGSTANRCSALFRVRWDGAALVYAPLFTGVNGTVSAPVLRVVNGRLTLSANVGATGVSLRGSSEFTGHAVEDGVARTGTVAGVVPTLTVAATDAGSAQDLANSLRSAVLAWGLAT